VMTIWRMLSHNFLWKLGALALAIALWVLVVGTQS